MEASLGIIRFSRRVGVRYIEERETIEQLEYLHVRFIIIGRFSANFG